MKLQLHPNVIYRVPRFPLDATLEECWDELKAIIADSSRDFYALINKTDARDIHALPERTQQTIRKYFNRARYRCVPYGGFAGVGLFRLQDQHQSPLTASSLPELHSFTDWSAIERFEPEIDLDTQMLVANTSWYETVSGIRYLAKSTEGYELCDNLREELVLEVLHGCSMPITLHNLQQTLKNAVPLSELRELVLEMIELQLLFTSAHSNIIGRDYWCQTAYHPQAGSQQYQISTRKYISGNLSHQVFRHVPELARRLSHLVAPHQNKMLSTFVQEFRQKFEQTSVPLMQALDPEMGVGYAGLEAGAAEDDLIASLAKTREAGEGSVSHAEAYLKRALSSQGLKVVRLEELEPKGAVKTEPLPLPNTTTLMCSIADDLLVAEMFGGATATAINGRFSLASEQILQHCRSMCQLEADANPDVLFFDIGYQVGGRIDNVNRRRQLYDYSLSILNYDTSSEPLGLNDIMVSLAGETVLLWSNKHNKRLIPRMASAYNSGKSDLPVFRFLCDVQHQGIQSFLQLGLSRMIQGFRHYPRLVFKNIIVSPAKWHFKKEELLIGPTRDIRHCREQLKAAGIQRYFKSGYADQTLCYDLLSDDDLNLFLTELAKQEGLEVEEVFQGKKAPLQDENGRPYAAQFVLSYFHCQQIYRGIGSSERPAPDSIKLPGSDWIYFEVYCHPQRVNSLLKEKISPFIDQWRAKLRKWFFIRYSQNGDHLRIRFQLNTRDDLQALITAFNSLLQPELERGIVSDLLIRPYRPEVQRYGAWLMETVEAHFCLDSECVLALLLSEPTAEDRYAHVLALITAVERAGLFTPPAFSELIGRICHAYEKEHQLATPQYARLNAAFRGFTSGSLSGSSFPQTGLSARLAGSLIQTLNACGGTRRGRLTADLIHMHVNRLFETNQRTHELMIYYYFQKLSLLKKKTAYMGNP